VSHPLTGYARRLIERWSKEDIVESMLHPRLSVLLDHLERDGEYTDRRGIRYTKGETPGTILSHAPGYFPETLASQRTPKGTSHE